MIAPGGLRTASSSDSCERPVVKQDNPAARPAIQTQVFSAQLRIEADAEQVRQTALRVLASIGQITNGFAESSGQPRMSAIVGSGLLKLNAALVKVHVESAGEHASDVSITAGWQAGLIDQRTAKEAVGRFKDKLLRAY